MVNRYIKSIVIVAGILSTITACTKTEVDYEPNRPTLVRIPEAENEINILARDVLPALEEFYLFKVDRSATTPGDLGTSSTVKVTKGNTLITAYNTAHGTSFVELPSAAYTLSADLNNLVFAAGEFEKEIAIKVDKTQLDLSNQYALGFTITEVSGGGAKISSYKDALFSIGIKNKYHGSYHASGVFHHPTNGDRAIDEDKELITAGPNSVKTTVGDIGGLGYQMVLTVDPVTNLVTITPAGATPNIDQSPGMNYYDPATRSFHLHYAYNTAAPRVIEETITKL